MYEGGDGKIAKLFPTYLMNPANCKTFVVYGIGRTTSPMQKSYPMLYGLIMYSWSDKQIKCCRHCVPPILSNDSLLIMIQTKPTILVNTCFLIHYACMSFLHSELKFLWFFCFLIHVQTHEALFSLKALLGVWLLVKRRCYYIIFIFVCLNY